MDILKKLKNEPEVFGKGKSEEAVLEAQSFDAHLPLETNTNVVYTNSSLGLFKEGNDWFLAKIQYNPLTGEVGKLEKLPAGTDKAMGEENYRIQVVELGIF